ncbi:hypothetical protein BLAT2472_30709 [Burkholderia latens]
MRNVIDSAPSSTITWLPLSNHAKWLWPASSRMSCVRMASPLPVCPVARPRDGEAIASNQIKETHTGRADSGDGNLLRCRRSFKPLYRWVFPASVSGVRALPSARSTA